MGFVHVLLSVSSFLLPTPVCHTLFLWILSMFSQTTSHPSALLQPGMQFIFSTPSLVYHLCDINTMGLSPSLPADRIPKCCHFLHRLIEPPVSIADFCPAMIPISFREHRRQCYDHSNIRITTLNQSFLQGHMQHKKTCLSEDTYNTSGYCPIKLSSRGASLGVLEQQLLSLGSK